jgi:hypothetical protein
MLSVLSQTLRPIRYVLILLSLLWLSACELDVGGGGGPFVNTSAPVPVALLIPFGSGESTNDILATSLQNAAQLAVTDLGDVKIELRVYPTSGTAAGASVAATKAANEGAKIILGPVFAEAANAAGSAVSGRGLSVLSFSNNSQIAGGNVFVLGHTFENTANRLIGYAKSRGFADVLVVHANTTDGQIGRDAVQAAAANNGVNFTGSASYEFSQQGVISAVRDIAQQVKDTKTTAIMFESGPAGALPILAELLPENGVDPKVIKFIGLTRWDIPTQTLSLSGLQGGWFALPDPSLSGSFKERYTAAYGRAPHPLAGLAYDAVAAVGALIAGGDSDALSRANLTQRSGFAGVNGVFRLRDDGTNERAMAVVEIEANQVKVIDPAPRSFDSAGF